jgi:hypothetical protein
MLVPGEETKLDTSINVVDRCSIAKLTGCMDEFCAM